MQPSGAARPRGPAAAGGPDALPGPLVGAAFVASYVGLNELSRLFSYGDVVFLWYPPAALTLVLLWRGRPALVWLPVVAGLLSAVLDLSLWDEPWRALPFAVGNAAAYLAGALGLRRLRADPALTGRGDVLLLFFVGGLASTLLAALLGVTGFVTTGLVEPTDALDAVGRFWMGDVAGVTTFAPLLLLLRSPDLHLTGAGESRARQVERAVTLVVLCAAAWLSAASWSGRLPCWGESDFQPMTLVIVPMVWVGLRERLPVVALAILAVNVICLGVGAEHASTVGSALTLQVAAATTALVGLALGTSVGLRVAAETSRAHDALHDRLTGLPNALLFADRVAHAVRGAREDGATTAVLVLGLDDLDTVTDSLGRPAGDHMLRAVAWRLATDLPSGETVAHLDGERFGVLVTRGDADTAARLAEQLLRRLDAPVRVQGQPVYPRASVGVASAAGGTSTAEELCQDAESALRRAKAAGGGRCELAGADQSRLARRRLVLEGDLRECLAGRPGLALHYQPLVDAGTGAVVGHEALLRWTSPALGQVSPPELVALAETTGLGRELLRWVLASACAQAVAWSGATPLRVAVNVSAAQLEHPELLADVEETLAGCGLPPDRLVLEITESGLVAHEHVVPWLAALRERGVRVSLDDFGTGWSSLAYLTRLPLDELKVDQSFVRDLPGSPAALAVVTATVSMARSLHLEVVGEGVETAEQAEVLRELGCGMLQGLLFGGAQAPAAEPVPCGVPGQRAPDAAEPA